MVQTRTRTRERTIMETVAKQAPTSPSSEIVKLIRKLRWVGLEDKAKQLEKELEQHAGHRHGRLDTKRDRLIPKCKTGFEAGAPRVARTVRASQPPHDYRDPRPRGYLSAAIVRRRCQEAPFSHLQRARLIIRWKSQNNLGHAWNRGQLLRL
jgi:hypothetical protein